MTRWPAEAIWEAVVPAWPGFTVEVLSEVDSTNSELMRRARAGQVEPALLVAERQTAGRGRLGRAWHSGPEVDAAARAATQEGPPALTFSLGLPLTPRDWSGLSLLVGLVVAETLDPRLRIKWPNDLWWQDRKLAGILVETASAGAARHAVIGIGINIAPRPAEGLATPPAALRELRPEATAPDALDRVVPPLMAALREFERQGFAPFAARYARRDALLGRPLRLSDGLEGVGAGVDLDGSLLVHTPGAMRRVNSSEVSVRPTDGDEG